MSNLLMKEAISAAALRAAALKAKNPALGLGFLDTVKLLAGKGKPGRAAMRDYTLVQRAFGGHLGKFSRNVMPTLGERWAMLSKAQKAKILAAGGVPVAGGIGAGIYAMNREASADWDGLAKEAISASALSRAVAKVQNPALGLGFLDTVKLLAGKGKPGRAAMRDYTLLRRAFDGKFSRNMMPALGERWAMLSGAQKAKILAAGGVPVAGGIGAGVYAMNRKASADWDGLTKEALGGYALRRAVARVQNPALGLGFLDTVKLLAGKGKPGRAAMRDYTLIQRAFGGPIGKASRNVMPTLGERWAMLSGAQKAKILAAGGVPVAGGIGAGVYAMNRKASADWDGLAKEADARQILADALFPPLGGYMSKTRGESLGKGLGRAALIQGLIGAGIGAGAGALAGGAAGRDNKLPAALLGAMIGGGLGGVSSGVSGAVRSGIGRLFAEEPSRKRASADDNLLENSFQTGLNEIAG